MDPKIEQEIKEAEAKGRREQLVDGRLNSHEQRLNAINGNLERGARAQETVGKEMEALRKGISSLAAKLEQSEAVAAALAKASVSRREFMLGCGVIVASLLAAILTTIH